MGRAYGGGRSSVAIALGEHRRMDFNRALDRKSQSDCEAKFDED